MICAGLSWIVSLLQGVSRVVPKQLIKDGSVLSVEQLKGFYIQSAKELAAVKYLMGSYMP